MGKRIGSFVGESKKIKGSDLIEAGYLKDAISEAKEFLTVLGAIEGKLKAIKALKSNVRK